MCLKAKLGGIYNTQVTALSLHTQKIKHSKIREWAIFSRFNTRGKIFHVQNPILQLNQYILLTPHPPMHL